MASVRDARVADDVVETDVAPRLHALRGEKETHPRCALHRVSALAELQPLRTEPTLLVKQEAKH